MRVIQALIAFAVVALNIRFKLTDNNYLVGAWAICAAYGLTIFPLQAYDWWAARHVRRAENAMKKQAGIPYGWRIHLPGAARRKKGSGKTLRLLLVASGIPCLLPGLAAALNQFFGHLAVLAS